MSNSRRVATALEPGIHKQMCHSSHKGLGGCVHLNYLMPGRNGDGGLPANLGASGSRHFHADLMGSGAAAAEGGTQSRSAQPACWPQAESWVWWNLTWAGSLCGPKVSSVPLRTQSIQKQIG